MTIAVDFDQTITKRSVFPITGKVDTSAIEYLLRLQESGNKIVLYSARKGNCLDEAIKLCEAHGLIFDEVVPKFEADVYIDDRAIRPEELW